jgi:hypothetical protein
MPANYVLIEKITVGAAGASSVTFSGIPQTGYTDLVVKVSCQGSIANSTFIMQFNGSATGYTSRYLRGSGTAANSYTQVDFGTNGITGTYMAGSGSAFDNGEFYVPNYTSANYKSASSDAVDERNTTAAYAMLAAGLWSNTAAITSLSISADTGSFLQYSTFYLYGVAKLGTTPAIVPYATGGDTIMTDGTYWYHAFTASGTFTPAKGLSCDVLVVAGGGGGGADAAGGGGGAGGLLAFTSQSLASGTGLTVTIGAGGTGGVSSGAAPTNGSDSQFGALTLVKGGGYGGFASAGANGGSGGGGGATGGSASGGGTATSGQGNNGGTAVLSGSGSTRTYLGGGGGGSASVGADAVSATSAGAGGAGVSTYSAWGLATTTGQNVGGTVYYAGGGGGGAGRESSGALINEAAGGNGGGGAGGSAKNDTAGTAGTANTGGGGGGGEVDSFPTYRNGAAGGSGIVIVRYTV